MGEEHLEPADVFKRLLPEPTGAIFDAQAFAPSNIALSKYWGKRDATLNLPLNSSLSISLADWGTTTRVGPSADGVDHLTFNGDVLSKGPAAEKIWRFVDLFRQGADLPLTIETENSIPTAAGLASSASGFAALTLAVTRALGFDIDAQTQSQLARMGSGSATRSFWHGFARWDRGQAEDGSDSFARPIDTVWPAFRIAIIPVDTGPKATSSTDGMNHTVATSPLFANWPAQAEADCAAIEGAVLARDLDSLGPLVEANALAMHATMMAARPSVAYLKPETWQALETLWAARRDGLQAYATMDAGANMKLVFLDQTVSDIGAVFPTAKIIAPFDDPPDCGARLS